MSTKNPKVSAYVPQHIFDRFQSFCQEKEMSMSQATAVVFAGYFEIEPEVNHLGGLLADRIKELELKLPELSASDSHSIDFKQEVISELTSVLLQEIRSNIDEVQKSLFCRLESELKSSLLEEFKKRLPINSFSEPQLDPTVEDGHNQLELGVGKSSIVEPAIKNLSNLKSKKPKNVDSADEKNILTASQLDKQMKSGSAKVSNQKSRYKDTPEKFVKWSKDRHIENIAWEFKEGSSLFYRVEPLA